MIIRLASVQTLNVYSSSSPIVVIDASISTLDTLLVFRAEDS